MGEISIQICESKINRGKKVMYSIQGKGIALNIDEPFELDGVKYASSWLRYSTQAEKDALGIVETPKLPEYDANFYTSDGTPKNLEDTSSVFVNETGEEIEDSRIGLKTEWINKVNYNRNQLLQNTDWYIVRKYERDVDVPAEVEAYRAAVHAEGARLEEAILAATTVEELKEVVTHQNWPTL